MDKLIKDENISIVIAEPTVHNILELKNTISCPSSKLNESQVNFFLQLLWDDGLLNAIEKNDDTVVLKIPNFEIKTEIQRKCYTQSLFEAKYNLKSENIERYIQALKQLVLTSSNEQESEVEENNEEKGDIQVGTTEKCEEAVRNFVNAVSLLFSGDAAIPVNESELHHILFYLTYNNMLFKTQSTRPFVKASEQLRDAKTSSQNKGKEKHRRKKECDICVTRGTGGVILELKLLKQDKANENSKAALQQIIDRKYYTLFDKDEYKHVRTKIYVGLCFKKNLDVAAYYLVDNIDINKAKFVCRNNLNEVIEASSNLLEFFGELLPYNKKVKNYFLDEKLFLENIPTSSVTEENDTTNILILLSQIIFTIGPLGSRNFSLFIENCIKLFCKSLCLEDSGFLIQNILKQIPISVYYVNHNLRYQVIFLSICSRNHSFVNLFCSYYKDKQEYCKFHNFADSLEDKLLNMEDTKLFIQISCNIINITYNISRKDYLLIQQQDNKVCGCISKLFKLTILIIYKILKLYNLHHFKYPLLQRHIKILIFLMFNAYDFTQESIGDHAVFKEIVYTLVHLDVKIDNLKDLEKLCAKEEFPTVPKEKFKNVCF